MGYKTVTELIEGEIPLGRESGTGFRVLRCAVCNDYQERAGFKFNPEGPWFSCFNCGLRVSHEEGRTTMTNRFRSVLEAYGIRKQQIDEVLGATFFKKATEPKEITLASLEKTVSLHTPEVKLPAHSHPLGADHHDELQAPLIEYLLARGQDPVKLQAHFSLDQKFLNRVILPCTRNGKVIFWQARTITAGVKPRYLSPSVSKEAVLWGYDNMWKDPDKPLFIAEGIFNAAPLDGVALIGSKLNEAKIEILNKCRRRKIVLMDKDGNGELLAQAALKHGWEISWPGERGEMLDVDDCVQERGILYTVLILMRNATVPTGVRAADGLTVQSKLALSMEQALAKIGRK
jgi:hypothetical protein